jgi:hypothetical protein
VAQLVERAVWDREVGGSNPLTPTRCDIISLMSRPESLGFLPEQELAKFTSQRIQELAIKSGYEYVLDPKFFVGPSFLSHNYLSLYRNDAKNEIISAVFREPKGSMPWYGSLTFTNVLKDPTDDRILIHSDSNKEYSFFTDGEKRTRFLLINNTNKVREHDIRYPEKLSSDKDLIRSENITPDNLFDDDYDADESLDSMVADRLTEDFEQILLTQPLKRRSSMEIEDSRRMLLELNRLIENIFPNRDLIIPPNR